MTPKVVLTLALVLASALTVKSQVPGGRDPSVCHFASEAKGANGNRIKAPSKPVFGSAFECAVSLNIITKNRSTEFLQWYSFNDDHSVIQQREKGARWIGYADYKTNQLLGIQPEAGKCSVSNLTSDPKRFMFGYQLDKNKQTHVSGIPQVLHILQPASDTRETYVGPQRIRGIPCHVWYTCTYWEGFAANFDLYWYFSDPDQWTPASGPGVVPVRAWVKGRKFIDKSAYDDFEHVYEFIHWRKKVTRAYYYQTPRGISCPGRVNTKPLPTLSTKFSYTQELVNKGIGLITFVQETYDFDRKLFRYQYRATGSKAMVYGDNILNEVHDYNTGIAYIIDTFRGNCSIQPIQENAIDGLATDQTHVIMRDAATFLYLDKEHVTYEGIKQIRGMDCDTWVAVRRNFPPGTNLNATFEWAFKTVNWSSEQDDLSTIKGGDLVQIAVTQNAKTNVYYNIYNFQRTAPKLLDFDVSPCYVNRNRRVFQVSFPAGVADTVARNMESFQEGVINAISSFTGLSKLRIGNVQVNFQYDVILSFELLDISPVSGNLPYVKPQTDLKSAANALYDVVRTNNFIIPLQSAGTENTAPITALPTSIKEKEYQVVPPDNGYGTGVTAAVAVVMAVVGVGLGGGGAFVVNKKCLQG